MPSKSFQNVYHKIVSDPNFFQQLKSAPSADERLKMLHTSGLDPNEKFSDLVADVEELLRTHGRPAATTGGVSPQAVGPERAVEWVAAAAVVIAAGIAT